MYCVDRVRNVHTINHCISELLCRTCLLFEVNGKAMCTTWYSYLNLGLYTNARKTMSDCTWLYHCPKHHM